MNAAWTDKVAAKLSQMFLKKDKHQNINNNMLIQDSKLSPPKLILTL